MDARKRTQETGDAGGRSAAHEMQPKRHVELDDDALGVSLDGDMRGEGITAAAEGQRCTNNARSNERRQLHQSPPVHRHELVRKQQVCASVRRSVKNGMRASQRCGAATSRSHGRVGSSPECIQTGEFTVRIVISACSDNEWRGASGGLRPPPAAHDVRVDEPPTLASMASPYRPAGCSPRGLWPEVLAAKKGLFWVIRRLALGCAQRSGMYSEEVSSHQRVAARRGGLGPKNLDVKSLLSVGFREPFFASAKHAWQTHGRCRKHQGLALAAPALACAIDIRGCPRASSGSAACEIAARHGPRNPEMATSR
ncbi:hypothetical protein EWM64_g8831 [Hericium alpestre]|uniref:Uncharacterized protein n=1 Tax=Hericium alpestre TaxID=135208 RepID=A0A4Y9ZMW4_9AGAM|nr:hypothetical protein EWM64_g8831 [Hericium alpestre]